MSVGRGDSDRYKWWQRWRKGSMLTAKEEKKRWREKVEGPDATAGKEVATPLTDKAIIVSDTPCCSVVLMYGVLCGIPGTIDS